VKETAFLDTAPGATAGSQIDRTIARRSDAVSGAWTISVPGILRTIPPPPEEEAIADEIEGLEDV